MKGGYGSSVVRAERSLGMSATAWRDQESGVRRIAEGSNFKFFIESTGVFLETSFGSFHKVVRYNWSTST